ncbi:MAG: dihydroneopterin aldolase [Rhodospirillaceae bacterium]|nr:dihydroneopterin aldolase [Rhodospirillaceae bacterium]|tara:strand:- start:550 stop:960 length:411 start_codon:yes stop_codon:yes gene_type:complete
MTAESLKDLPNTATLAATRLTRRVLVRDLVIECLIGVYRHERDGAQRVRVNLDLSVFEMPTPIEDKLSNVLSYEDVIISVRKLATAGHVNLVETLAEQIADLCLSKAEVSSVKVCVEKLDVFADAASVGIEIERSN